jgi:pseudouridine synthase
LLGLQNGVVIDGEKTAPCKARIIGQTEHTTSVSMIIHEGRNRQVRKMMEAIGKEVLQLTRIRMGELCLGNLKPGEYRQLSLQELAYLRKIST